MAVTGCGAGRGVPGRQFRHECRDGDEEGYSAFDSKLPKITVRDNGSFKLKVKEIPSGKYFVALQRALPKEMAGDSMATAIPILITEKQQALIIEVPGSFPMNVGKLFVAVRAKKEPPKTEAPQAEEPKKEAPPTEEPKKEPSPESPAPQKE
jgi:hypothetical protein